MLNGENNAREDSRQGYTVLAGIVVAGAAIAGGFMLEHGKIGDLVSLDALLLVAGGTAGAVLVGSPLSALASSWSRCRNLFGNKPPTVRSTADHIVRSAAQSRRLGIVSLEREAEEMEDGFLRRALFLVIDGVEPAEVRRLLEADIAAEEDRAETDARIIEQAGGYAPTIGILGAVIGLIQVMKQLGNVDEVGRGIASAFTSTLYGVALANLVLLPLASRMRSYARAESIVKEVILEGVTAMREGLGPHTIRMRLETMLGQRADLPARPAIPAVPPERAARKSA